MTGALKNLKKIFIWVGLIGVIVLATYIGGYTLKPHSGSVLGVHQANPGFGPLLEKK